MALKYQRDSVSHCVERTQKRLVVVEPRFRGDTSVKETPSGATQQCRRSSFMRDEACSGQDKAKSIANLIERSFN